MNLQENKTGIIKITSKPTGFVELISETEAEGENVIIFEEDLNCALNRDEVEIEITGKSYDKKKGRVIKIIKRNKTDFVGTIKKSATGFLLIPDDFKFYRNIEIKNPSSEVKEEMKALLKMDAWTDPKINPSGTIVEIIGKKGLHETEMRSILVDKGIIYDFPPKVEKEATEIAKKEEARMGEEAKLRKDIRGVTTFTIDPVDAKDFDDALSFEEVDKNTYRIGVHIADVSHFVRPGTLLDKEARKREFSVYLVDRTIPMLPEILSNGLCSLNPNVDRLAFSAIFDLEKESGKVKSRWFGKSIINSDKRFSYEEAQEVIDLRIKNQELSDKNFGYELSELDRIAKIYRKENKENGAIEFETEEVKFELDETGKPIRVFKKARVDTMKMIEEWMLLANREVAKFIFDHLEKRGGASIFRIHDSPNMDKLQELAIFVRALGHELKIEDGITAREINELLMELSGHPSEGLVRTAAVKSMAKAVYSTKNIGHFGLAFEYYTHFTSPIRRYPDLVIHRTLEKHLNNGKIGQDEMAELQKICDDATEKEIAGTQAERESIRYKQVEYMMGKIGQEFEGIISGVTEWGIYIEEPNTKAEGMAKLKEMLDDTYVLDEKNYAVIGIRTKKKYSLGDKIKVRLASADLDRKNLDFKVI